MHLRRGAPCWLQVGAHQRADDADGGHRHSAPQRDFPLFRSTNSHLRRLLGRLCAKPRRVIAIW